MPTFSLYLLGAPRVEREGVVVPLERRKALALLAYLAVTGECQRRETLAALFWPEAETSEARAALRRTLSVLNTALGGVGLDVQLLLDELFQLGSALLLSGRSCQRLEIS